jgi:hypothetical protein
MFLQWYLSKDMKIAYLPKFLDMGGGDMIGLFSFSYIILLLSYSCCGFHNAL